MDHIDPQFEAPDNKFWRKFGSDHIKKSGTIVMTQTGMQWKFTYSVHPPNKRKHKKK